MRLAHHFHLDRTATTLVASNLLTIVLALVEKWQPQTEVRPWPAILGFLARDSLPSLPR